MNNREKVYRQNTSHWYLERIVFLITGIFIIVSSIFVILGTTTFIYFTLFVGIMLINFTLTGYCPMSILLDKLGVKEK